MRRIAVLCLLLPAGCGSGPPSSVVPADASIYLGVNAGEDEDDAPPILLAARDPAAFAGGLQLVEFDAVDLPALGAGPTTSTPCRPIATPSAA